MTSWDIFQQTFALSSIANALREDKGQLADLQRLAEEKIPKRIQDEADKGLKGWDVVWGPTVHKHVRVAGTHADHTWYIAHNPSAVFADGTFNTYTVAIAGTSSVTGLFLDFQIGQVVDFEAFMRDPDTEATPPSSVDDSHNSYIALGTAKGAKAILKKEAPPTAKSSGRTIGDFLSSAPPQSRITFAGHSLGASLATVIALQLQTSKGLQNVQTYPTAGYSPGNKNFNNLFESRLPSYNLKNETAPWQVWNTNIANILDPVVYAWSTDNPNQNLEKIRDIWGRLSGDAAFRVNAFLYAAKKRSRNSKIIYDPLPVQFFTPESTPATPKTWADWQDTFMEEHVYAYRDKIGLKLRPDLKAVGDVASAAVREGGSLTTRNEEAERSLVKDLLEIILCQQSYDEDGNDEDDG